ncbi:hypothetical protein [Aquimarina spongiae]|nr:hypothetical protein [Aquimarina spongiae]
MTNPIPFDAIGQDISVLPNAKLEASESLPKANLYSISGNFEFLGVKIDGISLGTNKQNIIQTISIAIPGELNRETYNLLVDAYGEPKALYNTDQVIEVSESVDEKGIRAKETKSTMKECTFDEEPKLIVWDNNKGKIELSMARKRQLFRTYRITFGDRSYLFD